MSCRFVLIINQDAHPCAIQIIKLAGLQRPEKGEKANQAKPQRDGDEQQQTVHFAAPRRRKALATTMMDDPEMAAAAISGVTSPMIARGTAITL